MTRRIALIDGGNAFERAISALVSQVRDLAFLGRYSSRADLFHASGQRCQGPPDILFVDFEILGSDSALPDLFAQHPGLCVIAVAPNSFNSAGLLRSGVSGCVLRSASTTELEGVIRVACGGGMALSPAAARLLTAYLEANLGHPSFRDRLTEREREIMDALISGSKEKAIAASLGIAADTVHTHIKTIFKKLKVHSRFDAIREYLRRRPSGR